jgi:CRP-like cAMP-binding protein
MADDITDRLRTIPLFAGLDYAAVRHVTDIATVLDLPKGSVLIERGLAGSGMYVVLDGVAEVELRHRTIELGPGEVVGELALLTDKANRTARVRAGDDLRCLAIGRSEFWDLLNRQPRIAVPLLSTLARRLQDLLENPA